MKQNIAVVYGGESCEHDISVISALQAIKNIDTNFYNIIPVYITKSGSWVSGEGLLDFVYYANPENKGNKVFSVFLPSSGKWLFKQGVLGLKKYKEIDAALVIMHGLNGEDGTVSGLLELCKIPYTNAGVLGSSVCLDKGVFKAAAVGLNIPVVQGTTAYKFNYLSNPEEFLISIEKQVAYPLIVKPCNLGSSIGISVCANKEELEKAIALAFELDDRVLIEAYLENCMEVNIGVLGLNEKLIFSKTEQPLKENQILNFENKYINSGNSMQGLKRIMPAPINPAAETEIKEIAKKCFQFFGLKGVVRLDFIIHNETVYLNEINTIPGSLAFYLFAPQIEYKQLISRLIENAIKERILKNARTTVFASSVLSGDVLNGIKK